MTISTTDIEDQAKNPKSVRTDEGRVEENTVNDLIKADQYGTQKSSPFVPWGLKIARAKPSGTP